jgi:hypothetical protein
MSIQSIKKDIIHSIAVRGTLDGALQRNSIYKKNKTTNTQRKQFREYLSQELERLLQRILSKKKYTDADHFRTIAAFSDKASRHKIFRTYLVRNRLKIGTAQKLINLYWKMNWLLKPAIKLPLHCPFDCIIIRELDNSVRDIRWTLSDKMDDYKRLVAAARAKSGGKSIFEWELKTYGERTLPSTE